MSRQRKWRGRRRSRRTLFEPLERRLLLASDWQNPLDARDVSGDGVVAPDDVLRVINFINLQGIGQLPVRADSSQPYLDVTGDGQMSSGDALPLINLLNADTPTPYRLEGRSADGTSGRIHIGLGQDSGTRVYSFALDASFDTSDSGDITDKLQVYLVDPSNPSQTLLDGGVPGSPILEVNEGGAVYPNDIVSFDGGTARIDLTSLGHLAEGELVFELLSEDQDSESRITIRPLSNEVLDGVLLTNFPVSAGEVVTLEGTWLRGSGGFEELGFVTLDDESGTVGGVLPDEAGYAEAVRNSPHRQPLFSNSNEIGDRNEIQLTSAEWLGLYVFQHTLAPVLADHLQVYSTGDSVWEVGWEESKSIWPDLPDLGNRGYDDAVIQVQQVTDSRPLELMPIDDQLVDEETLLTLALNALGGVSPETRRYELEAGPVAASLDAQSGLFSWRPDESQGPGSYDVSVRVVDGAGASDTESFSITVQEVNSAPTLGPIGGQTIDEGQELVFTATASDADIPVNDLVYSIAQGAPAAATIDPASGEFRWSTSEADGPGEYTIEVRVTDEGGLSDSEVVAVIVNEVNLPPVLETLENQTTEVAGPVTLTARATDPDRPANVLRFSLDPGAPAGASIDPVSGQFVWTPAAGDAGVEHSVTVRVTDGGGLSDTQRFTITVSAVDRMPPVLAPIGDQEVDEGQLLAWTAAATDTDSRASDLVFSLDSGAPSAASIDAATGQFSWTPTESDGPGDFTVTVRVMDESGLTDSETVTIRVREVNLPPTLDTIGNKFVEQGGTVTFTATASDPDIPENSLTYSIDTGAPQGAEIDPATGQFRWTPSGSGTFELTVRVTDNGSPPLGDSETITVTTNCPFDLSAWTIAQSGGSESGRGGVEGLCQADMHEGDSFLVTMEQTIVIPEQAVLEIRYDNLGFDLSDTKGVNDAFEAALIDSSGNSLVHTFQTDRDAFLNITEDQGPQVGAGTRIEQGLVSVDLSEVFAGTEATLILRLINNDADTESRVSITDFGVTPNAASEVPSVLPDAQQTAPSSAIDFDLLSDVTASFDVEFGTTSFDEAAVTLFADTSLTNRGAFAVDTPLVLVIDQISNPSVRPIGFDGLTPDNKPYYDFTSLIPNGTLGGGDTSEANPIGFSNTSKVPFSFDHLILAQLNHPPRFVTDPVTEIIADMDYRYDSDALDLDNDALTYELIAGPADMTIDAASGMIEWSPTVSDAGAQTIMLRVDDGRGGIDEQSYLIDVLVDPSNRPPTITSIPIVSATVGAPYEYPVMATDPDQDPIFYGLTAFPRGMTIDSSTGLIDWTPDDAQLGEQPVTVSASDGRGGVATQTFSVQVTPDPRNRPPIIVSDPVTVFDLPGMVNPPTGDITPQIIRQNLGPGETATEQVALTLSEAGSAVADIVFLIDESESMAPEHAWIEEMVLDLDEALIEKGIGPNRYSIVGFGGSGPHQGPHFHNLHQGSSFFLYDSQDMNLDSLGLEGVLTPLLVDATFPATDEYVLVVAGSSEADSVTYGFRPVFASTTTAPITIGEVTQDALEIPGDVDRFTFTITEPRNLLFETLTFRPEYTYTIEGPSGVVATDEFGVFANNAAMIGLPAGDYTVTVEAAGGETGDYYFQLSDLQTARPIDVGTPVTDILTPHNEVRAYQFTVDNPGERFFFDVESFTTTTQRLPFNAANIHTRLFDPLGNLTMEGAIGRFVTNDREGVVLPHAGTYTLLLEGKNRAVGQADYTFGVYTHFDTAQPLALGETINSEISQPGEEDNYTFSLDSAALLYFDSFTDNVDVVWNLTGPGGLIVDRRPLDRSDDGALPDPAAVTNLLPGDYQLQVDMFGDRTAPYSFRLLDIAGAPALSPGQQTAGELSPGNETDLYRFDAVAGESYFFDFLSTSSGNPIWRLVDPFGRVVFNNSFVNDSSDEDLLTLQNTGTYTVMIEGRVQSAAANSYSFNVHPFVPNLTSLSLGNTVAGTIAVPGAIDSHQFSLDTRTLVYFDSLSDLADFHWTLTGPSGVVVSERAFNASDTSIASPIMNLVPGDYVLDVDAVGDSTGSYEFRLHDITAATPLTPGTPISAELDPANETDLYRLAVSPGDLLAFDSQGGTLSRLASWRLIDPSGAVVFAEPFNNDVAATTLDLAGDYTLLVEERVTATSTADYEFTVEFLGNTPPPNVTGSAITLGDTVTGSVDTANAEDVYTFTLPAPALLYFDSLTNSSAHRWTMTGPTGTIVNARRFNTSDAGSEPSRSILDLVAGDYFVTVTAGSAAGAYVFGITDLSAATPIITGTRVDGELNPGNQSDLYRFDASAGERFYFESHEAVGNSRWRLVDPYGRITFDASLSSDVERRLTIDGTHTLLVEGRVNNSESGDFGFTIHRFDETPLPLTLGELVTAQLDVAGDRRRYVFNIPDETLLYFDSLAQFSFSQFVWSLTGPTGSLVSAKEFSERDLSSLPIRAVPGEYVLSVDAKGDATGEVSFRLSDLNAATRIFPGSTTSGSLSEALETHLYRLDVTAGESFYFDHLDASGSTAQWRLIDPDGRAVFNRFFAATAGADADTTQLTETGGYTVLVEGSNFAGLDLSYSFVIQKVPESRQAISLGDTVSGSISVSGASPQYTFSLTELTHLYVDVLAGAFDFTWSLEGPAGTLINRASFSDTEQVIPAPLLGLPIGEYTVTIDAPRENTGDFEFRVLDLSDVPALALGESMTGTLSPGPSSRAYSFDAAPGQQIFFDWMARIDRNSPNWSLVDPYGQVVFDRPTQADDPEVTVRAAGRYTLLVQGSLFSDEAEYSFRVLPTAISDLPLPLGTPVTGEIASPGNEDHYHLSLAEPTKVYFDALSGSNELTWQIARPSGAAVAGDVFGSGAEPPELITLSPGDYTLTVDAERDVTGTYGFQLVDVADMPRLTPDTVFTGTLSPATATDIFQFDARAGDRYFVEVLNWTGSFFARWKMTDPDGQVVGSHGLRNDSEKLTLTKDGTYYFAIEGSNLDTVEGTYEINVHSAPLISMPLSGVNESISGEIATPGETHQYQFTLESPRQIYVDSLGGNSQLGWTLNGPSGTLAFQSFAGSEIVFNGIPGEYSLDVEGQFAATGPYQFRLLDLQQLATELPRDTVVSGELDPANETDVFQFTAGRGDKFSFRVTDRSGANRAGWRLVSPSGNELFVETFNRDVDDVVITEPGVHLLLVQGSAADTQAGTYSVELQFLGNEPIEPVAGTPLAFDTPVSGSIAAAGELDFYTFTVTSDRLVYFDALTDSNSILWQLSGPTGVVAGASFSQQPTVLDLIPGEYAVRIAGLRTATGEYQFQLLDLAAGTQTVVGEAVFGTLEPPTSTKAYRLDASSGDRLLLDTLTATPSAVLKLLDPFGNEVFSGSSFEIQPYVVEFTGSHTLLVEGPRQSFADINYGFRFAPAGTVVEVDQVITGSISTPNENDAFIFHGTFGQRIYYDALSSTPNLFRTMKSPSGESVFFRNNADRDEGPVTLTETGIYELEFRGASSRTGDYSFRLLDISNAPQLSATDLLEGTLEPGLESDIYLVPGTIGQRFQIVPDGQMLTGSALQASNSAADSLTATGTFEDGYASIEYAIRRDPFRPGAAKNLILISDEDRDVFDHRQTRDEIFSLLDSQNIRLNLVNDVELRDGEEMRALGVDSLGTAYREAENGGFTTHPGGTYVSGFGTTKEDYIDLGWALQGAVFDLNQLRIGGNPAISFSNAFVDYKVEEIQNQFRVDLIASDPNAPFENLTGQLQGVGDTLQFDARFTGDGAAHSFDLQVVLAGTGVVLGTVPVIMNVEYAYPVRAIDPDGDVVTYSLIESPDGASIDPQTGHIDWEPDVPGEYSFLVKAVDGRGGEDTQQYQVTVAAGQPNQDPSITSSPLTQATAGRPYSYTLTADDSDGHSTRYFATTVPEGMTIDRTTGQVTWTPTDLQIGNHSVALQVLDGFGGQAVQEFVIEVTADSTNEPPDFVSEPVVGVISGEPYRYQSRATDPNADPLAFDLVVAPAGMSVAAETGLVAWRPLENQVGEHNVFLRVRDGRGGVDLQSFTVTVVPANTSPVITSVPGTPAVAGQAYVYAVRAQDAEGNVLEYTLSEAPDGMDVGSASGLIAWTPQTPQVGTHTVSLIVEDGQGGQVSQSFVLEVLATSENRPPVIVSSPRDRIALGQTYTYAVSATDPDHDALAYSLPTAPSGMSVTVEGVVTWEPAPDQMGDNVVMLQVDDGRGRVATQTITVSVVSQIANRAPVIVSDPGTAGTVGHPYEYDIEAIDADGDPFAWLFDQAPRGMSIDPQQGTIRWTPSVLQIGTNDVAVRVFDTQGGTSVQEFSIDVRAANVPPIIATIPIIDATVGQPYTYQIGASDVEGDPLTYSLPAAAVGMTIDPNTGLIEWTPQTPGASNVTVLVEDDQGGAATQEFTAIAHQLGINRAPRITSFPRTRMNAGMLFEYQLVAVDPEGAVVSYSHGEDLDDFESRRPLGMQLDTETGFVQWIPTVDQVGLHTVSLVAADPGGSVGVQVFELRVFPADTALTLESLPVTTVTAGATYRYDVMARDTSGSFITYALTTAPEGMEIDALGRISWLTDRDDIGIRSVELIVSNDRGLSVTQEYEVTVEADIEPPSVSLRVTPSTANLGDDVTIVAAAADNVGVVDLMVTLDGMPVALDAGGRATITTTEARQFDVAATAIDATGNTHTDSQTLRVIDPTDSNAPVVSITSPGDGAEILGATPVIGTVTDDNLLFYTLEIAAVPDGDFVEVFRGTGAVIDGVLGELDTTLLRNDSYRLRVSAQDSGGNITRDEVLVFVSGNLKVGNFALSFTDLSLPVAGIPLTIVRTYDSLNASLQGDLGYGWSMDFLNVDIRTSVSSVGFPGLFDPFEDGTRVYVTLPSGTRQGFTFEPVISIDVLNETYGQVDFIYEPRFVPDPGVTSELTVEEVYLLRNNGKYYVYGASSPYNPADPLHNDRYILTNKFGVEYWVNPKTSEIQQIKTPPGDTLTVGRGGIISSDGPQLLFERDAQGRIRRVVDPSGNSIDYTYDSAGDLITVNDREGHTTQLKYDSPIDHYLTEVIDPLGRTGFRTEYDESGRVARVFDAFGNPIEYEYLLDENTERIFDANGNPTAYTYDDRGNVVQTIDALGGTTTYEIDADNNVIEIIDPLGNTSRATFDDRGNQTSTSDALGNVTYQMFTEPSQLESIVDPLGFTIQFGYDSAGNANRVTDALNQSTTLEVTGGRILSGAYATGAGFDIEYDSAGNMERRAGVDGSLTEYTWGDNRQKLSETFYRTINGALTPLTTRFGYDREGRTTAIVVPDETPENLSDNPRVAMEYNAVGQVTASVDELGRRTEFEYDLTGQRIRTVYPDGLSESWAYDAMGNNTRYTDRGGRVHVFEYDELNRQVKTIIPDDTPGDLSDNPVAETVYDAAGRTIAEVDPVGNRTEFEYDAAGSLIRMLLPEVLDTTTGELVRPTFVYSYDKRGQLQTLTDTAGGLWKFEYDAAARLVATTNPLGDRVSKEYDQLGRVLTETDTLNRTQSYTYDARGLVTSVTAPAATDGEAPAVYRYEYDEAGLLIKSVDPMGRETLSDYDLRGRMIGQTLPGGQRSSASYDDVGNLVSSVDFNGEETRYEYDELNRRVRHTFDDGTEHVFTYTATGQIASIQTPEGTASYEYDAIDRLVSVTDVLGQQIGYEYSLNGQRTAIITDSGTTRYVYGAANRLVSVVDTAGGTTSYGYDGAGNLVSTVLPNGTTETRQHDAAQRLTSVEHQDAGGTVIDSFAYELDPVGRRTRVTESGGRQVDYVYDNLNRLISELITDPMSGSRTIHYEYDLVGNRLLRNDSASGISTYEYDDNDRLITEESAGVTTTYSYNDNGTLAAKQSDSGERTTYTWDPRGRLIRVEVSANGATTAVEYTYGADGAMVARDVDGAETKFLVDTNRPLAQVIEERTDAEGLTASYVHGLQLISQTRGADTAYYHADGIGSIRALTDSSGQVTDTYLHGAFGRLLASAGDTANDFGFAGQRRDPITGLDYLRARHLDTSTGRFISVDPIAGDLRSPLTMHAYTYVSNNPVNLIDPTGQFTLPEVSVVSAISRINSALSTTSQINRACNFVASIEFLTEALHFLSFFSFLSFNVSNFIQNLADVGPSPGAAAQFGFRMSWEAPVGEGETLANGKLKKIDVKLGPDTGGDVKFSGELSYMGFPSAALSFIISTDWDKVVSSLAASVSDSILLKEVHLCRRGPQIGEVRLGLGVGTGTSASNTASASADIQLRFGVPNPAGDGLAVTAINIAFPLVKAIVRPDGSGRLDLGGITVIG